MKRIFIVLGCFIVLGLQGQDMSGLKIFINPGHGGHDSDDRNVVVAPFKQGDPDGFWESNSNLDKGLMLRDILESYGASTQMSRTQNRTEDDLGLDVISGMANAFEADFFFSIHSNANNGHTNFPLQLFRGYDNEPVKPVDKVMATILWNKLISNQIPSWTTTGAQVRGDWSFYNWGTQGLGVLRHLTVPGILSEGSFHDYVPETYRLLNKDYRWLEAWNFMRAIREYFEVGPSSTGNIAGDIRDSRNIITSNYFIVRDCDDELLPLNEAVVTISSTGAQSKTDTLFNGVYLFKNLAPGEYQLKAEAEGYFAQDTVITVTANETAYCKFRLNKVRNTPPEVVDYSPKPESLTDSVECSEPVVLYFNWDMDKESVIDAFSITPAVEGTLTFEDSQYRLRFTPTTTWDKGTLYTIRLAKSAKHPGNMSMNEDFSYQFVTKNRNRLQLLSCYPASEDTGVYIKPQFRFVFDRKLETSNLQTAIRVYDSQGNEQAKNVRKLVNNKVGSPYGSTYFELISSLEADREYRIVIDGEVRDEVNIPVYTPIEYSFRTSAVAVTDKTVAEDFEEAGRYSYSPEHSEQVSSGKCARNTSTKLFGKSSYQFSCSFQGEGGYAGYQAVSPSVTIGGDRVMGAHIYGDLSGNELLLEFTGGETDVRYIPLTRIDFAGWEYAEVSLQALGEDKEYQLTGFRIVQGEGPLSGKSELYLDNLLVYDKLINSIREETEESSVRIYPNPARDRVYVQCMGELTETGVYSLDGRALLRGTARELDVSGLPSGTYVLRVRLSDGVISRPLIIAR